MEDMNVLRGSVGRHHGVEATDARATAALHTPKGEGSADGGTDREDRG